jgi:hypothetical protein
VIGNFPRSFLCNIGVNGSTAVQYWRELIEKVKNQTGLPFDVNFTANLITYLATFIPMRRWNLKDYATEDQQEMLIASILSIIGIHRECEPNS